MSARSKRSRSDEDTERAQPPAAEQPKRKVPSEVDPMRILKDRHIGGGIHLRHGSKRSRSDEDTESGLLGCTWDAADGSKRSRSDEDTESQTFGGIGGRSPVPSEVDPMRILKVPNSSAPRNRTNVPSEVDPMRILKVP